MIATSVEQSKKLLELGLSPESADMCYEYMDECDGNFPYYSEPSCHKQEESNDIPCWSVGALLEVMPEYIKLDENYYHFKMTRNAWPDNYWYLWYSAKVPIEGKRRTVIGYDTIGENKKSKSIIEATYKMIVWLLENNYIKKTNEDREQHNNS